MFLLTLTQVFLSSRFKNSKAKNAGGEGLGYRERPGLGAGSGPSRSSGPASQALGGSVGADPSGPASNRLSALRSAFENQYKSQVII